MITLREALQEYVMLRRSLGYKFRDDARSLERFVAFMEERRELHITARLALDWVQQVYLHQPALFAHWQLVAFTDGRTVGAG